MTKYDVVIQHSAGARKEMVVEAFPRGDFKLLNVDDILPLVKAASTPFENIGAPRHKEDVTITIRTHVNKVPDYVGRRFRCDVGGDVFTIVPDLEAKSPNGTVQANSGEYRTLYIESGASYLIGDETEVLKKFKTWIRA